jgi:hypothetical protein
MIGSLAIAGSISYGESIMTSAVYINTSLGLLIILFIYNIAFNAVFKAVWI